jgi:UDP-3-O-[3-hydroxymyristoyl] glucosamine N-acyltransferase
MRLGDLAERLGGALEGDPDLAVRGLAGLESAGPGELSFLANPLYAPHLAETGATAVLVRSDADMEAPCALIRVENPDLAFARAAELLLPSPPRPEPGVHPSAVVHPEATLGEEVAVGACAVVEAGASVGAGTVLHAQVYVGRGAEVGEGCELLPGVVLYHGVRLGDRVRIHAGSVVGSDGFGYVWDGTRHVKVPQAGTVEIGDDVEIGAGSTIDRARFGTTVIGPGTKLDNLVQIAHNVEIGAQSALAAQVGVSGSTRIGRGVLAGGQCGFVGHITVGDGVRISAQAGVLKSVPGGVHVSGYPARPHRTMVDDLRNQKALPRLRKTVRELEERIRHLEEQQAADDRS